MVPAEGCSPGSDGSEVVATPAVGDAPAASLLLGGDALATAGFADVLSGVEAFLPPLAPLALSAAAAAFPVAAGLLPSAGDLQAAGESFGPALPAAV